MKLCISLGSRDFDKTIFERHELFEFRLDLADLREFLPFAKESIVTDHKDPKSLEGLDATYVDLDHAAPSIQTSSKIIRSFHDHQKTPDKVELLRFIHKNDDSIIKKVACKINKEQDLETLFSLLDERDNLVIIPMGDPKLRLVKTKSLWTYSFFGIATAPGQLSFEEMMNEDWS